MTCPKCRRGLSPVDVFCGFCGARAVPGAAPAPGAAVGPARPVVGVEATAWLETVPTEAAAPPPASRSDEGIWVAVAEPAGFWIRMGAFAVDAAILTGWVGIVWAAVMGAAMADVLAWAEPAMLLVVVERTSDLAPITAAAFSGVLLAYLVAFVVFEGATPGKMLFRLRVLGVDGPRVGVARALAREAVGRLVGVLTLGVGFAMVAFAASKRGLHDVIARTRVVRLPEERPAEG